MKLLISFLTLFLVINISYSQENENDSLISQEQNLSIAVVGIQGMACQEGCADKIAMNLQNTAGVVSAVVSYETKEAVIKFKPDSVSVLALKSVITNTKVKEYVYTINTVSLKNK
ncbi:MAG: copper chaperone CopZ [Maribacter sp.]|jgi:copper chaperone CopZ